jgi:2-succinyl-6-hydroxy-2,4-cyclohexadiene-1-carboxylate synthase
MIRTIDGHQYSVVTRGMGQPVVCLHGFAEDSSTWEAIQPENCQMILVDLIGHGQSGKPEAPEPYSLPTILRQLHELIHCLGFKQYAVLGYSMGGRIALAYALAYPQEVTRLLLESSAYGVCEEQGRSDRRRNDVWLAAAIRENGIEWFNHYWSGLDIFASQARLSPDVREKISRRRLQNEPHALAHTLLGTGQGIFPCLQQQIPDLSLPVLYIYGEHDYKYKQTGKEFTQLNPAYEEQWSPVPDTIRILKTPAILRISSARS